MAVTKITTEGTKNTKKEPTLFVNFVALVVQPNTCHERNHGRTLGLSPWKLAAGRWELFPL